MVDGTISTTDLHLLICTFTISVIEPEKDSYIYDDRHL